MFDGIFTKNMTTKEAFKHFIEHVYPYAPSTAYKKKVRVDVSRFKTTGHVSEEKMTKILKEYGYKNKGWEKP